MVSNVAQSGENSSASEANSKKDKKKSGPQYECVITCLDGSVINTSVEKSAKGEELLHKVVQKLDVKSKDYVGILFNNGARQWLDIHKDMKHQLGDSKAEFLFRVKFYEPEPSKIQEDHLRYLLYLQIREDLSEERLKCSDEVIAQLGSYTAQAELGDFNLSEHEHDYLKGYEFAENTEILDRVNILHRQHRGQTPLQAELNFLEIAKKIPRYGMDIHDAMDTNGHVEIGIAALGINIYRDGNREHLFRWQNMNDFNYNRRKFTIKLKQPVSDDKKNYVYYFESAKSCKQCYKVAVEYHSFFRLTRPDAPRKRADTLKMGSSFRYSDRTLYQLRYQKGDEAPKSSGNFKRTPSTRKTLPHSYKTPLIEPEVPFIEPTKVAPVEEEPIQYEEVEIDEANPDDDKYDPAEWETVEKTMSDGSKKKFRRRIIILNVVKKPKGVVDEEPLQYEEVEIDEANPEDDKYDPKEWETVEKTMPDGSKKKFRRRIIILNVVKKPKGVVDEEPIQYEEVEIDEANPEDDKYDPKEWETVEKTMPDGSKKKFRRRIILVRVVKKAKSGEEEKPSEVEEEPIEYEEVEIDEANPQDDKFDNEEWEVVEKEKPDGQKVRVRRRRVIILKIVKKPEDLVNENEVTVEEMPLDENAPQNEDDKFDPEEWETIEKLEPEGQVKKYRRRISIVRIVRKSDEEPLDEKDCEVEEVPFNENENDLYDPDEWTEVERTRPDGTVKKYRRRLYIMKIVKNPSPENEDGVNYEEEEITEANPDDVEKYDPEEWEDLVKTQPDGTVKKYRRRIVVVKYVKGSNEDEEEKKPASEMKLIEEDQIDFEEVEVDESSPEFNQLLEDPEFEVVHKKRPDGTIVRVRRRAMRVRASNGKEMVLDECPMEFEETELDENSPEFHDALNDPESEIIEKKKSDGTIIRVRRRAVSVHVRKPAHTRVTISSHPVRKSSNEDPDLSYEEIPVDENSPVHFDKNIWEEYEKVMPDGSTKKFRRRYISKCNVILKKPSFRAEPTPIDISSNVSSDMKYEEVEIDPDDDQTFNTHEWEVIEKEQPDGTKKRFRRRVITTTVMTTYTTTRYVISADGEEDNVMESKPLETTTLTFVDGKPVATSSQDGLDDSFSPVEMSMSMDDLISEINQISTNLEQPITDQKKNVVTIETITPATTFVVESAPIDEEEARRRQEEERLEQEGLNATIDSIFTLPDDDEVRPLSSRRSTYDEDAYNESFDHELEEYGVDAFSDTTTETDGIEINLPDPTVRKKKKPKTAPKPRRPESFVKITATPRSSGSDSDDNRMNRTKSDASKKQQDYRPNSQFGDSEILYTVTDVSQVEQGAGGFVKAVKAKHENLAHEEHSPPTTPKGHVPTRTISFDENDTAKVIKTNDPPSVPVEPTTIIPAESELPVEDVIFQTNQPQEESFPDMEEHIEAMEVPEVETEVILIKQVSQDDVRVAPPNSEPGVVRTRPFLPRQDTQVIKTEIIEVDLTPSQMDSFMEDEGDFVVSTEQLPTEVITKTITIEGDSTELTQEEIQRLLNQAPEEVGDIGSITSTQVVRTTTIQKTISGTAITVSGDAEADELQRMLREAVTSETNQTVTKDEDGNIIITAVQDEVVEVNDDDGTEV